MKYQFPIFYLSAVLLVTSFNDVLAQERARTQFQEYSTGPGSFIQGIPVPKSPIKGSIYLYEDYSTGVLITNDKNEVSDVKLRYNLRDNKIEMSKNGMDIQLNSKMIHSFHIKDDNDDTFINVLKLPIENPGIDGFLQILEEKEEYTILKRWFLNIKKANYNIALSTGTKYDEAILKNEIYILLDNQLISFKGKNKEIKDLFPDHSSDLLSFKKDNNLNFKSEEDFIAFFDFLASLK